MIDGGIYIMLEAAALVGHQKMDQTVLMVRRRCERKPFRPVDVLLCLLFQLVRSSNLTWQEEGRESDSRVLVFIRKFRPAKGRCQGRAHLGTVGHRRSTLFISLPQHRVGVRPFGERNDAHVVTGMMMDSRGSGFRTSSSARNGGRSTALDALDVRPLSSVSTKYSS